METIKQILRKKFMIATIISVLSAIFISNMGFLLLSSDYVKYKHHLHGFEIVNTVEYLYEETGDMDSAINYLRYYLHDEEMYIILYDETYNIIFQTNRLDVPMFAYDLIYNDKIVGFIEIGHDDNATMYNKDKRFILNMNLLFLLAFIISFSIAYFINERATKEIVDPLITLRSNSTSITNKKYNDIENVDTGIIEIYELSRSLKYLSKELENDERKMKQLVSDVSHELKTPLTVLSSYIEAILDGVWKADNDKLSICHTEVKRLSLLVEKLTEITDYEKKEIILEEVDVSDILDNVVEFIDVVAVEKNIEIKKDIKSGAKMNGIENYLKQIFINLLTNSIEYTNVGGNINIKLSVGNDIVIRIKDDGCGIKGEDLPHIFDRFYRADKARVRRKEGYGIGLFIVKTYVELHNGSITVESNEKNGTEFIIKFPKTL